MEFKEVQEFKEQLEIELKSILSLFSVLTNVKIESIDIAPQHPLKGRNEYKVEVKVKI